jgi:glucosyl-3-phosphoglycerate phosphatase
VVIDRLVVVRHGRTSWNAAGRFQGQSDPGLDDSGWPEAATAAEEVAPFAPVLVVSSDLGRARQTAEVIARRAGVPLGVDRRLREVALGRLEGLDRTEAARWCPRLLESWLAAGDARPAGGESVGAGARVAEAITSYVADGTIVVVAHGIVLEAALGALGVADAPHLPNGGWRSYDRRQFASNVRERRCTSTT